MANKNMRVMSLTAEEFTRPPSYCPFCGEEVWGEGWNPQTGVRYYSHRKSAKRCGDEIALQGPAKAGVQ